MTARKHLDKMYLGYPRYILYLGYHMYQNKIYYTQWKRPMTNYLLYIGSSNNF